MHVKLPTGTVTFLFTDIEGSTKLLNELGSDDYGEALAEHRRILREAFARHGGVEVDTQGDAFFVAFPEAKEALAAAGDAQEALRDGPVRVRMGLHTGAPHPTEEGYVGIDVHRAARIAASGHGGQVLLSAITASLVEKDDLHDLGEHRLKDLSAPERIYQLGRAEFPPLKTISNTNLPRPASSFVGRERELEEIGLALQSGTRLLTLTGPGGSGKTRLAIEAAAELVPTFKNGVFWVGLAAIRDPALVKETVAQTIGAKGGLAEYVGEDDMLLVLDNFEQVVEAAPELPALLEACPNLRLVVTSRERLRVRGEVEYSVRPLADVEAVELFCTRSNLHSDHTIPELCRRLDNLPLAIELAAARTSVLSPGQILERVSKRLDLLKGGRDAEARQQTLRATIEWSYDLLSQTEQRMFAQLAVFAGGCTLEAAEEILDADLDVLQSLVDKSLLVHRPDRFWMLETIREFAAERLIEFGQADEVGRRHAEYFLALAEEVEPHLLQSPGPWLDRLEQEHDNFRAALDRYEASGQWEVALRLAGALLLFWFVRGHRAEGRRRFEAALQADERPTAARAKALGGVALMALDAGDLATAKLCAEEALAIYLRLGDASGAAISRYRLASALLDLGDPWQALPLFEESLREFSELGDGPRALSARHNLAFSLQHVGELHPAQNLYQENLRKARALPGKRSEAASLAELAMLALDEGRDGEALSMLEQSLRINREVGEPNAVAQDLSRLSWLLVATGRYGEAIRLLSREELLREEFGVFFSQWAMKIVDDTIKAARMELDDAAFAQAWEQGRALSLDEAIALALQPSTGLNEG